jgi:RAB protein geranylgeranyltransferase component A
MKQGKMTKLLKRLTKKPMAYGEMQEFLFKIDDDGSYPRKDLMKTYKAPQGYNCTNLSTIKGKGLIEKIGKLYHITNLGKKNINSPYAETKEELKRWLKNYSDSYRKTNHNYWITKNELDSMTEKYELLKMQNEEMERIIKRCADRELDRVIESDEFDSDLLQYLK